MSDSSQRLCELARQGDTVAASELVTQLHRPIFAYLRRLSGNDEEAADLTQTTFIKFWQSLPSFQQRSTVSTWLHGIAYHVFLDWRRKGRPSEVQPDQWWETYADDGALPSENAQESELAALLYGWTEQLEEDKRQVVHLHFYQGLSLSETAEVLSIATSTVKYRLREALQFLRTKTREPVLTQKRKNYDREHY